MSLCAQPETGDGDTQTCLEDIESTNSNCLSKKKCNITGILKKNALILLTLAAIILGKWNVVVIISTVFFPLYVSDIWDMVSVRSIDVFLWFCCFSYNLIYIPKTFKKAEWII